MGRSMLVFIGAIVSGVFGYVMFQITGLCQACESGWLQYVMGFAFVFTFLSLFRSGVNSRTRSLPEVETAVSVSEGEVETSGIVYETS